MPSTTARSVLRYYRVNPFECSYCFAGNVKWIVGKQLGELSALMYCRNRDDLLSLARLAQVHGQRLELLDFALAQRDGPELRA